MIHLIALHKRKRVSVDKHATISATTNHSENKQKQTKNKQLSCFSNSLHTIIKAVIDLLGSDGDEELN